MKTLIIVIITALLSIGALAVLFSRQSPATTVEVAVLRDVTDTLLAEPKANEILPLFNLSGDDKWNGAVFHFSTISDVSYNKISETKIEATNKWLSNEMERDREIKKFQNEISGIISDSAKENVGKKHSSIYVSIARELNRLAVSKSQKRILLIYSDLMENDLDVSLYKPKEIGLLKSNPDSLKNLFEKMEPLSSLTGVEVYLIYQPANIETDSEFHVVSNFYRNLLEARGAKVTIEANL